MSISIDLENNFSEFKNSNDNPDLLEKILLQKNLKKVIISDGNIVYLYNAVA